ncbi:hypothetical protein ACLE20_14975 [Rhizobium sp. YIM 134829]
MTTSTDKKAGRGMRRFVITIFIIAMLVAAAYYLFLTPADPGAVTLPG